MNIKFFPLNFFSVRSNDDAILAPYDFLMGVITPDRNILGIFANSYLSCHGMLKLVHRDDKDFKHMLSSQMGKMNG